MTIIEKKNALLMRFMVVFALLCVATSNELVLRGKKNERAPDTFASNLEQNKHLREGGNDFKSKLTKQINHNTERDLSYLHTEDTQRRVQLFGFFIPLWAAVVMMLTYVYGQIYIVSSIPVPWSSQKPSEAPSNAPSSAPSTA